MPKVSICVPVYNNVKEVKRLLDSIREQTYTDYEVNITDDSDGLEIEELIGGFSDERIRYVHNAKKLGHIFNWNAAIAQAQGEYIKIMFSDDWFTYPESLAEMVRMLDENPEAGLAFSNSMQVSERESYKRKVSKDFIPRLREDWRNLFLGNEIGAPSDTIYRNNGIMFDEKSNWASDMVLYMRLFSENPHFVSTDRPLISIGMHAEQYTHSFSDRDDRIFNDYLYMYETYNLRESERCREFFLKEYIVKFGKGRSFARRCGISIGEFWRAKAAYIGRDILPVYGKAALRKIGLSKSVRRQNTKGKCGGEAENERG